MLTTDQLAAIRERCERATPGSWVRREYRDDPLIEINVTTERGELIGIACIDRVATPADNSDFIAHAREDVPALLDALIMSREELCEAERREDEAKEDIANWKARCEAMERAILASGDCRCRMCKLWPCKHAGSPRFCEEWQFDEARFAGAGGEADHIGDVTDMVGAD